MKKMLALILLCAACADDTNGQDAGGADASSSDANRRDVIDTDGAAPDIGREDDSGTREIDVELETLAPPPPVPSSVFYVRVDGEDSGARDGSSPETAWATLGYACSRIEEPALLEVGPGTFAETQVIEPTEGVHIRGSGSEGA